MGSYIFIPVRESQELKTWFFLLTVKYISIYVNIPINIYIYIYIYLFMCIYMFVCVYFLPYIPMTTLTKLSLGNMDNMSST